MNLEVILSQIEDVPFGAYMNVASGFSIFRHGLQDSELVQSLIGIAQANPQVQQLIEQRFFEVLQARGDPDYAHPHDAALGAYLYTLAQVNDAEAFAVAQRILGQSYGLFWTRKLAEKIIETMQPEPQPENT